jgi:hypothetical protein
MKTFLSASREERKADFLPARADHSAGAGGKEKIGLRRSE